MHTSNAEPIVFYLLMAIVLFAMLFHRALIWYLLKRWGKSTRGKIIECLEQDNDGVFYVVLYEFEIQNGSGTACTRIGKQSMQFSMRAKDIVAVRYWPWWPRVNRLVERAF